MESSNSRILVVNSVKSIEKRDNVFRPLSILYILEKKKSITININNHGRKYLTI